MAITTVDHLVEGYQPLEWFYKAATPTAALGFLQSYWGVAGIPGPGAFDTTLNGVNLSSSSALVDGQIPFYDPAGAEHQRLTLFSGLTIGGGGRILLLDRLWHNGGFTITSTSAQNITQPTLPSRDADGATAGRGVLVALEVSANVGGSSQATISYTNSTGTAGRTGTLVAQPSGAPLAGRFNPFRLQAGDVGVRSVQSLTLTSSWVSGTINLVAYRQLAAVDTVIAIGAGSWTDPITGGLPRLYNGTVPFLAILPAVGAAYNVYGQFGYARR